jgi:hypothetical protein
MMNTAARARILPALAAAALFGASVVQAQEDPWYSGISTVFISPGSSLGFRGVLPGLALPGATVDPLTSQKQYGGYRLTNGISIEGAQTSYGATGSSCAGEVAAGEALYPCQSSALSLSGIATLPLESGLSLFGRLGLQYWQNGLNEEAAGVNRRFDDLGGVMGVGVSYEYSKRITLRAESEHYSDLSGSTATGPGANLGLDASVHSIGLSIKF